MGPQTARILVALAAASSAAAFSAPAAYRAPRRAAACAPARHAGLSLRMGASVEQVSAEQFELALQTESGPMIVDFFTTWCGPCKLIAPQLEKVATYLEQARLSDTVDVLCGGEILSTDEFNGGYFVSPAVVVAQTDDHSVVTEEVFGPLMTILKFSDESDVVNRANDTRLGLAAAVFSQDFARVHRVANELQAGIVWINEYNITPAEIPFGGYKESGIGRENGLQTIEHFTQSKTIYANLGNVEKTY